MKILLNGNKTFLNSMSETIMYSFPLLGTSVGTIGNVISIVIFCDKRFHSKPFAFYNIIILIAQFFILYIGSLKLFLTVQYSNLIESNRFLCKFLNYVNRPLEESVTWIQILMTLERYISIRHFKSSTIFKQRVTQYSSVLIILLVFFTYHLPVYLFYEIGIKTKNSEYNRTNTCFVHGTEQNMLKIVPKICLNLFCEFN